MDVTLVDTGGQISPYYIDFTDSPSLLVFTFQSSRRYD